MTISRDTCLALDASDPIAHMRELFVLPEGEIYLDGNSLGCLPKSVRPRLARAIEQEWARGLIRSWNDAGWYRSPQRVGARIAKLIGAEADAVIVTDSTSVNLFKVLAGALRLRPGRGTILGLHGDFPSDSYIAGGVAEFAGVKFSRVAADALVDAMNDDVAIVSLAHVNFKSGFVHDMDAITRAAHRVGALIVWDLSHSAGVMKLDLGACAADFAVGCGYKYLNGGPGASAYVYVAPRHQAAFQHPLTGWLGHRDPFAFTDDFESAGGTDKMLTGTPPMLSLLALDAALDVFDLADMAVVRAKSASLTELFVSLSNTYLTKHGFELFSPRAVSRRGAQVALAHLEAHSICQALIASGVIGDFRAPNILRFGLAPLTTRHVDVFDAVSMIDKVMSQQAWDRPDYRSRKAVT